MPRLSCFWQLLNAACYVYHSLSIFTFLLIHLESVSVKTHSSVSVAKKTKEDVTHKCVIYWYHKVAKFSLLYFQTTKPISNKFIYFLPYIYTTSHIKIKGNHFSSSFEIFVPENCPIFFTIFFFAQNYKYI